MCKIAPAKRCSSHLLENISKLETSIEQLNVSVGEKTKIIAQKQRQDSNFDETDVAKAMNKILQDERTALGDANERLHQEKAAFYLTPVGKQHLQEIIDDPNSSATEVLNAYIHHRTALTREEKDKEVMKIVKDEDLDVIDKEELLKARLGSVDNEIKNITQRLKDVNTQCETIDDKIEHHRIRGDVSQEREWLKVRRQLTEEGRYLTSYRSQLRSHTKNTERYLNRKQSEEDVKEREKLKQERERQVASDRNKAQKQNIHSQRLSKFDRFFDKLVRKVIMDWM